ncbi:4'-phosphopantetheinyl transferase superfamily protein [uncultured Alsobacter sp.]|uniref:4'-phosphopantetheinyl transferase family protein n=1 Tax=uncultured Alsobacter sp. TaxID=1748258 RepID=UPI0025F6BAA3|nr:4'-phosphopantetheinyl transferase superfamily protein [uncultured Alsobacter sp.]
MPRLVADGDVLVWTAARAEILAADGPAPDPAETERARAMSHPRSRERFLAGRLLLRRALGPLLGLAPAAVPVLGGEGEAPRLAAPHDGLHLSVSHGETVEAVAVAAAPVGVDVEESCPADFAGVAPVVMHEDELALFRRLDEDEARLAFRRLWTRKEAVLKAAGLGFSRDPRSFAVGIAAAAGPVSLDGRVYALAELPGGVGTVALAAEALRLRGMALR